MEGGEHDRHPPCPCRGRSRRSRGRAAPARSNRSRRSCARSSQRVQAAQPGRELQVLPRGGPGDEAADVRAVAGDASHAAGSARTSTPRDARPAVGGGERRRRARAAWWTCRRRCARRGPREPPGETSRSTPRTASTSPNRTTRPATSTAARPPSCRSPPQVWRLSADGGQQAPLRRKALHLGGELLQHDGALELSVGVSWPPASVKSVSRMRNFVIDSALRHRRVGRRRPRCWISARSVRVLARAAGDVHRPACRCSPARRAASPRRG